MPNDVYDSHFTSSMVTTKNGNPHHDWNINANWNQMDYGDMHFVQLATIFAPIRVLSEGGIMNAEGKGVIDEATANRLRTKVGL